MRRPTFLQGVTEATADPIPAAKVSAGLLRSVAWAAAAPEAAAPLPMQMLTAPPPLPRPATLQPAPPPAPAPSVSFPDGFEALASASVPTPVPVAPPASAPVPLASPPLGVHAWAKLESAVRELRAEGERLGQQARADALEVGFMVARKILEREISTDHEALFALIKSAIRRVGEGQVTVVRLCPVDLARFEAAEGSTALSLGGVQVRADEGLSSGDVMVDTPHHTVDGRMETRLEELARTVDLDDEA